MSRGANYRTREASKDTEREQKAQAGRHRTPAITRSTGRRRRERRFESCRGHHVLPVCIAQSHRSEQALARSRGMVRGTNSFHEPSTPRARLHPASWPTPVDALNPLARTPKVVDGSRWTVTIRGQGVRSFGAVLCAPLLCSGASRVLWRVALRIQLVGMAERDQRGPQPHCHHPAAHAALPMDAPHAALAPCQSPWPTCPAAPAPLRYLGGRRTRALRPAPHE